MTFIIFVILFRNSETGSQNKGLRRRSCSQSWPPHCLSRALFRRRAANAARAARPHAQRAPAAAAPRPPPHRRAGLPARTHHEAARRRSRAAAAPPLPPRPLRLRRPGLGWPLLCKSRASLPCAGEVLQRQHALRAAAARVCAAPDYWPGLLCLELRVLQRQHVLSAAKERERGKRPK